MCGICGVIGLESTDKSAGVVRRMLGSIVHRGPDEEGRWIAPGFAAGTRRLSIIDLPGGSQPIWNETETLAIFFNGEIYNFSHLREELSAAGHRFRTHSDTEVIVHAYEEWGEGAFQRLHGMFAFALAEFPQGKNGLAARVTLARDRFGIKPLYYAAIDGIFLFASEVRALLASGLVPAQICGEAIAPYLLFGSAAEPCTLVDRVFSMPPGYSATIRADTRTPSGDPRPYWQSDLSGIHRGARWGKQATGREAETLRVRSLLEDAVRSNLVADVPVGVFLSSGLDSTAIVALAARTQSDVHTFTVAFPDLEFSEAAIARNTASRLGTQHSELQLSGEEMLARLDEAVGAFDQPSMDGINSYFVSWAARQAGLKVALSGIGSDEIFGGYPTFHVTESIEHLQRIARALPPALRSAIVSATAWVSGSHASTPEFRKAASAWLDPDALPDAYYFSRALFTPQTAAAQGTEASAWRVLPWWDWLSTSSREARSLDSFTAVSWLELRSYMLNTLLRDTDAMSMHHSLEVRVPFLDAALVECVLGLAGSHKRVRGKPKSLLIDALADLLPPEVVDQPKRTFTFPWEKWLRGPLGTHVAAGLADWSPALAPVLNPRFALEVWENFQHGRTTWSRPWSLYVLNEWAKRHLHQLGGQVRGEADEVLKARN